MPAITLISSVPAFGSHEALESTPNSFSDLPVLVKHQEKNVLVTVDPHLEGYQSVVQGTLYILTSVLAFMPDSGSSGFQIEYPAITLHAISRGESGPSIYCQLDESGDGSGLVADSNETDEDDHGDAQMRELTIVPQNPNSVEIIFESLSQCASLHPDPVEEDGDDGAFVDDSAFEAFNGSEDQELSEVGRAALEHMESIICDPHHLLSNKKKEVIEEGALEDASEETTKRTEIREADDGVKNS